MVSETKKQLFSYTAPPEVLRETVIFAAHSRRVKPSRLAAFAGFRMPLWFSSIRDEHRAVREAAGLFDCTHMGIFTVQGAQAEAFLQAVTTNDVARLRTGQAQYAYLLDSNGAVLDDIIVYCRATYDYLVVVNAANKDKVKAWLKGLVAGTWRIDPNEPERTLGLSPKIKDLSDLNDAQALVDIAIQGPRSGEILCSLLGKATALDSLKSFHFREIRIDDITCLLARTGYTGARIGFELFVTRDRAEDLWERLLDRGAAMGLVPCGLGARDSLRIEAGLPLYGHELAGPHNLTPLEAGYAWAVKFDKDFFIGKQALQECARQQQYTVARLALPGQRGVRPIRPDDPVTSADGVCVGWVLSSATINEQQIALACIDEAHAQEGTPVGVTYLARNDAQVQEGRLAQAQFNDVLTPDLRGETITRFARF